jgi:hypothetical protein
MLIGGWAFLLHDGTVARGKSFAGFKEDAALW